MSRIPLWIAAAAGLILGLSGGWALWGHRAPIAETPAVAMRQKDSSLVLERAPDPNAKAPSVIPKGGVLERVVHVTVLPGGPTATSRTNAPESIEGPNRGALPSTPAMATPAGGCGAVRVDLALVRMPDGSRRVVASSPDGAVLGGVDVPVTPAEALRPAPRWAAGPAYELQTGRMGAALSRTIGPFVLSALAFSDRGGHSSVGFVAQIRF